MVAIFDKIFPKHKSQLRADQMTKHQLDSAVNLKIIDNVYILHLYNDSDIANLIKQAKYHKNRKSLSYISRSFSGIIEEISASIKSSSPNAKIIVVNIPPSRRRMKEEEYDHMKLVLKYLNKESSTSEMNYEILEDVLVWTRYTKRQTNLNRSERLKNVSGAMKCTKIIPEAHYIVVDDIKTTGSTLNEGKRALLEAGAKDVIMIAFASKQN